MRPILLKAGSRFSGKLRSTFVVLDDDTKVSRTLTGQTGPVPASEVEMQNEPDEDDLAHSVVEVQTGSGTSRARNNKRGADGLIENRSKR